MLTDINDNPALIAITVLSISIIFVIIGWQVLFKNAKRITSRSETYGLVTHTFKLVDDLLNEASIYWLTPQDNAKHLLHAKNFELKTQNLKKNLQLIASRGVELDFTLELRKARRAITLDAERVSDISDSIKTLKIEDMNHYLTTLKINIFKSFETKYPKN